MTEARTERLLFDAARDLELRSEASEVGRTRAAPHVVVEAMPEFAPAPIYPALSKTFGEQGAVELAVDLDRAGDVLLVRLVHSSGFARLDEAAARALRAWTFRPATRNGNPVGWTYSHRMRFSLVTGE